MRIGYSFWGFLGDGILDTPDGGRSHRATLLTALRDCGHDLILLQRDRDCLEADAPVTLGPGITWANCLPEIDLLWLEWRWPIPGRNTAADRDGPGFTPELDRQDTLIAHYTREMGIPTLLWDKDLMLDLDDPVRALPHVTVCEPALWPRDGARTLLFPVADTLLDAVRRAPPSTFGHGDIDLAYVGNRYDRDLAFERYFVPAARVLRHRVYGKWTGCERWPEVDFAGRIGFSDVAAVHASALCTVLLLPDRYATIGQMTQRLFEALIAGCLPLLPAEIRGGALFVPPALHVRSGAEVVERCQALRAAAAADTLEELVHACLERLERFRVSRQLEAIADLLCGDECARAGCHPFRGEDRVASLYRTEDRQRRRIGALTTAKTAGENPNAVIVELARNHATEKPRLLEIGCGRGGASRRLLTGIAPRCAVALDRSPAMLRAARALTGGAVETVVGDFHDLPFGPGVFDLVVGAFCLYHSDDPARVCVEIARCLDDGGVAVIVTKSADSYHELDAAVAAAGLDPDAEDHPSLYESFHSDNLEDVVRSVFLEVMVRHDRQRFTFATPGDAAAYACTVPKYRGCEDPDRVALALADAWPAGGLTMTSTVSFAVGRNR